MKIFFPLLQTLLLIEVSSNFARYIQKLIKLIYSLSFGKTIYYVNNAGSNSVRLICGEKN